MSAGKGSTGHDELDAILRGLENESFDANEEILVWDENEEETGRLVYTPERLALQVAKRALFYWRAEHHRRVHGEESLWKLGGEFEHYDLDREKTLRSLRSAFDALFASAPTIGDARVMALRKIDKVAAGCRFIEQALRHQDQEDARLVRAKLALDVVVEINSIRIPAATDVVRQHRDRAELLSGTWRLLLAWDASGASKKWEPANELLGRFGLAAASASALRHAWATRARTWEDDVVDMHRGIDLEKRPRETTVLRIKATLESAREAIKGAEELEMPDPFPRS